MEIIYAFGGAAIAALAFALFPQWAVNMNNAITGARNHIADELADEAGKLADKIKGGKK